MAPFRRYDYICDFFKLVCEGFGLALIVLSGYYYWQEGLDENFYLYLMLTVMSIWFSIVCFTMGAHFRQIVGIREPGAATPRSLSEYGTYGRPGYDYRTGNMNRRSRSAMELRRIGQGGIDYHRSTVRTRGLRD